MTCQFGLGVGSGREHHVPMEFTPPMQVRFRFRLAAAFVVLSFLLVGAEAGLAMAQSLEVEEQDEGLVRRRRAAILSAPYTSLYEKRHVQAEIGVVEDQARDLIALAEQFNDDMKELGYRLRRETFEATEEERRESQARFDRELDQLRQRRLEQLDEILLPHQQQRLFEIARQRLLQVGAGMHVFELPCVCVTAGLGASAGVEPTEVREVREMCRAECEEYAAVERELLRELWNKGLDRLSPELREAAEAELKDVLWLESLQASVSNYELEVVNRWMQEDSERRGPEQANKGLRAKSRTSDMGLFTRWSVSDRVGRTDREHRIQALNLVNRDDSQSLDNLIGQHAELDAQEMVLVAVAIAVPEAAHRFPELTDEQRESLRSQVDRMLIEKYQRDHGSEVIARSDRVEELRALGHELEAHELRVNQLRESIEPRQRQLGQIMGRTLSPAQAERLRKYARQIRIQREQERTDPLTTMIRLIEKSDFEPQDRDLVTEVLAGCRREFFTRIIESRKRVTERITRAMSRELREHVHTHLGDPYDYYEELQAELN